MWQTDRQTDRRTDRQTDRRTENTIHRAAWSQLKRVWINCTEISMAYCKTATTPLLTHWSYCSLALSHRYGVLPVQDSLCGSIRHDKFTPNPRTRKFHQILEHNKPHRDPRSGQRVPLRDNCMTADAVSLELIALVWTAYTIFRVSLSWREYPFVGIRRSYK